MATDRANFITTSRRLFTEVAQPSGAITSTIPSAVGDAQWQREAELVTPRVAALVVAAADRLGVPLAEGWFGWLQSCPQNLSRDRIVLPRYTTNGEVVDPGRVVAPDQQAWVLWGLTDYLQRHSGQIKTLTPLLTTLADGLESLWDGTQFIPSIQNLWESITRPAHRKETFTATLLLSATALRHASALVPKTVWSTAAAAMEHQVLLHKHLDGSLLAMVGAPTRQPMDAALLSAWWPRLEPLVPANPTLERIDRECGERDGLHPATHGTLPVALGGGAWPLLLAWRALVANSFGERDRAGQLVEELLTLADPTLPRQLAGNARSRTPACAWAHAFTVFALDALEPITE